MVVHELQVPRWCNLPPLTVLGRRRLAGLALLLLSIDTSARVHRAVGPREGRPKQTVRFHKQIQVIPTSVLLVEQNNALAVVNY